MRARRNNFFLRPQRGRDVANARTSHAAGQLLASNLARYDVLRQFVVDGAAVGQALAINAWHANCSDARDSHKRTVDGAAWRVDATASNLPEQGTRPCFAEAKHAYFRLPHARSHSWRPACRACPRMDFVAATTVTGRSRRLSATRPAANIGDCLRRHSSPGVSCEFAEGLLTALKAPCFGAAAIPV